MHKDQVGKRWAVGNRVGVLTLALGLTALIAACSAGSATKPTSVNTTSGNSGTVVASPATAPAPSGATATTATTATTTPTTSGSVVTPAHTTTTTTAARVPTTSPKTTVPPAATGPAPTAPGSYKYNASGPGSTITAGTTSTNIPAKPYSLVVSAPVNGTETWTDPNTTTSLSFNGSGVFLESESVSVVNATCTFTNAVASPPWPLKVGATFSGQANCGGGQVLNLSGRVTATSSVGGVATYLVQSTITLGGTNLLIAETDWYAPSLRLPVKSTVAVSGAFDGYSISSDSTYTLASL